MSGALGLALGCSATGAPVEAVSAPVSDATAATTTAAPPATTASAPEKAQTKLPKGAATKLLTLSLPVEPIFGLTVTLLGRTHKELAGPPRQVVGVWTVAVSRDSKTITHGFSGDSLHLEGSGLGATWVVDGPYDEERVTVWPGETVPMTEQEAVALARSELAAQGLPVSGATVATVTSTQGGVAQMFFGNKPRVARVRVGLHSRRMTMLEVE